MWGFRSLTFADDATPSTRSWPATVKRRASATISPMKLMESW